MSNETTIKKKQNVSNKPNQYRQLTVEPPQFDHYATRSSQTLLNNLEYNGTSYILNNNSSAVRMQDVDYVTKGSNSHRVLQNHKTSSTEDNKHLYMSEDVLWNMMMNGIGNSQVMDDAKDLQWILKAQTGAPPLNIMPTPKAV